MTPSPPRRLAPALGLFVLAPLIGEGLLGNLTVSEMALLLPLLAPMYGAGALLVREAARRAGRGPATMLVLGVAYGLVEEGLADQMLFNRYYAGHDLMGDTFIPALGMGGWLTVAVLTLHAVWSINVAIALVEALVPRHAQTPWLGRGQLAVTAMVFVAGSALVGYGHYLEERFVATPWQLGGTALAVVALVVAAFRLPPARPRAGAAPAPWAAGAGALVAGSLFLVTEFLPGWWGFAVAVGLTAVAVAWGTRWSRRADWGPRHRLALASGALLAYAWTGFVTQPESAPKQAADYVANAVLATGAVLLIQCARRRVAGRKRNRRTAT
ncbi:DUF998 domain-containing protein [Streptomyces sp. NPDC053048]|uniref:DUF998 domain-containing protein n=1 Tax=Streptomyces sp. NPDC053048 TaxID=3365694 RepID=UPI0037D297E0